jgi:hypothetical protein
MAVLKVRLTPLTWIRAPIASKEQVKRYILKGWLPPEAESLDRAFPRAKDGKIFIMKLWLEAPMVRAAKILNIDTSFVRKGWRIVKKIGTRYIPVDYIEIPAQSLSYPRAIITGNKQTVESFEYLDSTTTLEFLVEVKDEDVQKFMSILAVSGGIGLMSGTAKGYGKFTAEIESEIEEEAMSKTRKTKQ